jgi:hypothetical protein
LLQIPTEQEERTPELGWMLQTRQPLVSAFNYNTFPHYTDYSVQASHENTVIILNKNEHSKNASDTLTKRPVHILSPKADTLVSILLYIG